MEMETACKVLEEQKAALEKLLDGYRGKLELSENLRRAYDELLPKYQEARQEIDRYTREIATKTEENVFLTRTCDDLKASVCEKDCALRRVSSAYEQIKVSSRHEVEEVEDRNRKLATALQDANTKVEEHERKVSAYKKEVVGIKALLSETEKKCLEAEKRSQAAKELREREEIILKLEQEKVKIGEKLKWKVEQFNHLEDAYAKLQKRFCESEKELRAEKSRLVDEICTLQSSLDSQTRVAKNIQSRLQMCNQALAHEESRRKLLEIQVSESRVSYENVVMECEEVKLKIERLTQGRDAEIAEVRNMLASKQSHLKEVELQNDLLRQENQDIKAAMKELNADLQTSIDAKTEIDKAEQKQKRSFIRELEQKNREIEGLLQELAKLQERLTQESQLKSDGLVEIEELKIEREANWKELEAIILAKEEITKSLEKHKHEFTWELAVRDGKIKDLQQEIALQQEAVMKVGKLKSDAEDSAKCLQERLECVKKDLEISVDSKKEVEELLEKQTYDTTRLLELKDSKVRDLLQESADLREELERKSKAKLDAELALKPLQDEIEATRKELESLSQVKMQIEETFEKEKQNFSRELKLKDRNLLNLFQEITHLQEELQHTRELKMEGNSEIRALEGEYVNIRKEWNSFLQEKEIKIKDLQQEIALVREKFSTQQSEFIALARIQATNFSDKERNFVETIDQKDNELKCLLEELNFLEKEHAHKEIEAVLVLEHTRRGFDEMNKAKDEVICHLQNQVLSQKQLTKSVETAVALELADREFEINALNGSLKRMVPLHFLGLLENEFLSMLNHEKDTELDVLEQRSDLQVKQIAVLENYAKEMNCNLETQRIRFEDIIRLMETKEKSLEADTNKLQSLIAERDEVIILLLGERESMVSQIAEMTDSIGKLSCDRELAQFWHGVTGKAGGNQSTPGGYMDNQLQENNVSSRQKNGVILEFRQPLKEHNGCV